MKASADPPPQEPAPPRLAGLGTAVPGTCRMQEEIERSMARLWRLEGEKLARWRRIVAGTGIETRHGVMAIEDVINLTTAQRMKVYEHHAPSLAAEAARRALASAGLRGDQVTHLVVVSCTGFAAPGVDVALNSMLGLRSSAQRMMIGFMGCYGAITGLRAAVGICAAQPCAAALVVCVELCSLHMRSDPDVQNQVASALFADGAAAAVVTGASFAADQDSANTRLGRLTTGASLLLEQGQDWMSWRITDRGFAMTLTREVPAALAASIGDFVDRTSEGTRPRSFAVHPGGPGILDAVDSALGLHGAHGLGASRQVLRRFGNMSSGTVLFVLDEALQDGASLPVMLLAFGPGLTIESLTLLPDQVPGELT